MKRLLSLAVFSAFAASAAAQSSFDSSPMGGRNGGTAPGQIGSNSPPVTNPEPITLVALAGGAAVAGGLLRRRKQAK